jgi:hypothetical protein
MSTTDDPHAERKRLTFEQAEGVEALPSQLQLKELSKQLRAMLSLVSPPSPRLAACHARPTAAAGDNSGQA